MTHFWSEKESTRVIADAITNNRLTIEDIEDVVRFIVVIDLRRVVLLIEYNFQNLRSVAY